MRTRALFAIVLLLVPALSNAQRTRAPRMGGGPAKAVPLSPQPAVVATQLAYRRLPMSLETYPLISHFRSTGFTTADGGSSFSSGGAGTRIDLRVSPVASATLDMTTSFIGGPALTQTVEAGTRFRPRLNDDRRVYPFLDVRVGYAAMYASDFRPTGIIDESPGAPFSTSPRFSQGLGFVGGAGLEYGLTRSLSLMTAASVMRMGMRTLDYRRPGASTSRHTMTGFRYLLGLRYNPVRMISMWATDQSMTSRARPVLR